MATAQRGASSPPHRHTIDDWGVWVVIAIMLGTCALALASVVARAAGYDFLDDPTTTTSWPAP